MTLAVIVALAFLTEAIVGFGSTVLTVTLGAHLMGLDALLAAFVPVSVALSASLLARAPGKLEGKILLRYVLPPVGVGMAVGMALFRLQGALGLQLAFGLFVAALALVELLRQALGAPGTAPLPRPVALGLLGLGGLIHGLFGSGGPMIVYVLGRRLPDRGSLRSTLAALWIALNVVLLVNYAALGLLGASSLRQSAALVPSMLLGLWLGDRLHGRMPERPFRLLVYLVLLVAGGSLAIRTMLRLHG